MRLPDFIGVGYGRCGTTALFSALRSHPDFGPVQDKELNFFGIADRNKENMSLKAYSDYFKQSPKTNICGEVSPAYIDGRESIEKISRVLPNVKIVITSRQRFNRFKSQFLHHRKQHGYESFEEYAVEALSNLNLQGGPRHNWFAPEKNLRQSIYQLGVSRVLNHFPRRNILFVKFENLQKDFQGISEMLQEFIGLKPLNLGVPKTNMSSPENMDLSLSSHTAEALHKLFLTDDLAIKETFGNSIHNELSSHGNEISST